MSSGDGPDGNAGSITMIAYDSSLCFSADGRNEKAIEVQEKLAAPLA